MTLEAFRETPNAQPFQPFTIYTADGRTIPVVSREFIMRDPQGRTVYVHHPEEGLSKTDLLLVTELKTHGIGDATSKRRRRN